MKTVLVLFAHPNLEKSSIHKVWLERALELEGVTVRDLYELYPEFDVDVSAEQEALAQHDVVVLQHPLYWYSTPALVKQWLDLVLEHGWAYGTGGDALAGKLLVSAISTGGKDEAYQPEGFHGITLEELLAPLRQTARLCKMRYLPPFVAHGAFVMSPEDILDSARDYVRLLEALRDEALDLDFSSTQTRLAPPNPLPSPRGETN